MVRECSWSQAYICLGSNIGNRQEHLLQALQKLRQEANIRHLRQSSIYETDPVGYLDQPAFLNMAARLETLLSPQDLLRFMLDIENELGRTREIKNGPRTIDLDLLLYDQVEMDTPELILPHPRMQERAFVMIPLLEVYRHDSHMKAHWPSTILETLEGKEGVKIWKDWHNE